MLDYLIASHAAKFTKTLEIGLLLLTGSQTFDSTGELSQMKQKCVPTFGTTILQTPPSPVKADLHPSLSLTMWQQRSNTHTISVSLSVACPCTSSLSTIVCLFNTKANTHPHKSTTQLIATATQWDGNDCSAVAWR